MNPSIWDIEDKDWPAHGSDADKLNFLVQYAILSPSGHNTQPWLFIQSQNALELYADRSRRLPVVDPEDRELVISCGCALYFLRIAARRFGYDAKIDEFPNPLARDLLARINISPAEPASEQELNLFNAISKRHTNRYVFEERSIPLEVLDQLVFAADDEDSWLQKKGDGGNIF